jgi:hypothetical protein
LTITTLFVFELTAVTRPTFPAILSKLINPIFGTLRIHPPYLPFQIITIAHQACISIFIAISQLAPLFQANLGSGSDTPEAQQQLMQQTMALASLTHQESQRLLTLEVAPFVQNPAAEKSLRDQLKSWIVLNEIRNEQGVQSAIQRVVQRRNESVQEEVE